MHGRPIVGVCIVAIMTACAPAGPDTPTYSPVDPDEQESTLTREDIARSWVRSGDWLVSPPLDAPEGASRVGILLELQTPGEMPAVQARILQAGAPLAEWTPLETTWSEAGQHVAVRDFEDVGDAAELRLPVGALDAVLMLQWSAVIPGDPQDDEDTGEERTIDLPIRADLQGLGIVTREQWGASSTRCSSTDSKYKMAIHHTVTPSNDPESRVRAIQRYHQDTRGWCDIGYHFLVGTDGRIYEGRPLHLVGAHVGGQNTGNIGVSFVGCFHSSGCGSMGPTVPPEEMIELAGRLLGTLSRLHDIELNNDRVRGHRDHPGASTTCPGDNVYVRIDDMLAIGRRSGLEDPAPEPPEDPPEDPPEPASCEALECGACAATAGCDWCAARGSCAASADACAWTGEVGTSECWDALWPCAVASCWNPEISLNVCDLFSMDEDFSSGAFSVHRYWTTIPEGGPVTVRLERTAGTFAPALVVADRAGVLVSGGDPAPLHDVVTVTDAVSGRSGAEASVTLEASATTDVFVYVTGWEILDAGFAGGLPTSVRYRLSATQDCTGGTDPPVLDDTYAGLTQSGSEIPRVGLYNPTLHSVLGTWYEPYGTVVSSEGQEWVSGTISWFGGPEDTGIGPTDTGAITGEIVRSLNDPVDPDAATLAARPEDYYWAAMRWNYSPNGRTWWADARIVVANPSTGVKIVVRPVDWGPNTSTGRIIDLSPQSLADLGLVTDDTVYVAFAPPGTPLGVVP
jgi:hypothetical protein